MLSERLERSVFAAGCRATRRRPGEAIETAANAFIWAYGYDYRTLGVLVPLFDWGTWFYRDADLEGLLARASAADDPDEGRRVS